MLLYLVPQLHNYIKTALKFLAIMILHDTLKPNGLKATSNFTSGEFFVQFSFNILDQPADHNFRNII